MEKIPNESNMQAKMRSAYHFEWGLRWRRLCYSLDSTHPQRKWFAETFSVPTRGPWPVVPTRGSWPVVPARDRWCGGCSGARRLLPVVRYPGCPRARYRWPLIPAPDSCGRSIFAVPRTESHYTLPSDSARHLPLDTTTRIQWH